MRDRAHAASVARPFARRFFLNSGIMSGYSGTPLLKKLGIKPGFRCYVHKPPPGYFDWLHPLPDDLDFRDKFVKGLDLIHLFAEDQQGMRALLLEGRKHVKANGMIWVSWPKKSSGVATDLDENKIRDFGLKSGLVDVKVCAVDDVWSGLKFVIPLKDRK